MFSNLDLIDIIIVLLICSPLFLFIFMVPIGDWLNAREKRKKAAAKAAADADAVESAAAKPA